MGYFNIKRPIFIVPSEKCSEKFEKIDKFMVLLDKSGVYRIINYVKYKDKKCKGRNGYNPYNLFAAIIYCFAKFNATLRNIEDKFIFDLRTIYIMEGNIPDHSTIGNFINTYIVPYQFEIFTCINKEIIKELGLDISDTYIDGTKIEANANKYKFVWKPTKFHNKLDIKIKELLDKIGYEHTDEPIKSCNYNQILKSYVTTNNIDINNIPSGRGKRLTQEQRNYKVGYKYLVKLVEYEEKERICGENRNSYFKTDHDATAMVLKEDYYSKLSHDFHAGYNIQVMVSSLLILMYGVFQDRSDINTLIPMNDLYFKYYKKYPINECDDAGYGNYKNYKYIKEHNIKNYIKFQNWEGESTGKNPQLFYTFDDGVMCLNTNIGEIVSFDYYYRKKYKDGVLYKFKGCNNCGYSYKCKAKLKKENRDTDYRYYEIIPEYELLKEEVRNNLLSPKGIEIRINRSIQVEGTFGQIKNNMNYDRIRRRGLKKVSSEIMLMCLGVNIRRYIASLDEIKFKSNCWNTPPNLKKEMFPSVKQKKKKV